MGTPKKVPIILGNPHIFYHPFERLTHLQPEREGGRERERERAGAYGVILGLYWAYLERMENTMESTIWCLWVGGSLRGSEFMSCIEPPASEHRDKRAMQVLEALVEGVVLGSPTS